MAREVGVPLMRGLFTFDGGDAAETIRLLLPLRETAQRDLVELTLQAACAEPRGERRLGRARLDERMLARGRTPMDPRRRAARRAERGQAARPRQRLGRDARRAALSFAILKEAGYVPHEVLQLHQCAHLREAIAACGDGAEAQALRKRLVELQQLVALRLERLRPGVGEDRRTPVSRQGQEVAGSVSTRPRQAADFRCVDLAGKVSCQRSPGPHTCRP